MSLKPNVIPAAAVNLRYRGGDRLSRPSRPTRGSPEFEKQLSLSRALVRSLALALFAFFFGLGLFTFPITVLLTIFWVKTLIAAIRAHKWRAFWLAVGAPLLLFWPIFWLLVFAGRIELQ